MVEVRKQDPITRPRPSVHPHWPKQNSTRPEMANEDAIDGRPLEKRLKRLSKKKLIVHLTKCLYLWLSIYGPESTQPSSRLTRI